MDFPYLPVFLIDVADFSAKNKPRVNGAGNIFWEIFIYPVFGF